MGKINRSATCISDDSSIAMAAQTVTVGVLALQGAFVEHISLLQQAAASSPGLALRSFDFVQVRTVDELGRCDGLVIPGGESTTLALVATRSGLMDGLRQFVGAKKPTWGTCAGLILLAERVDAAKEGGQQHIGGLDVCVHRNHFGRQINSFEADVELPFLKDLFHAVFIRAPVVSELLDPGHGHHPVRVLGRVNGDIVAVQQDNIFGTSFHPELTDDTRIHAWWLEQLCGGTNEGCMI
ncbi:glutamine amidotransferase subunit pdxt [Grosmannia clavigera kw1407]|uniref:glutaminase n=1 Tax=Grosmannia clavigera (strain kw1407 / UAMH 11150) TaxID=655863 RepID=F0XKT5_GROCL|nr:glutamine amidotransferase subunit pdxt [Grosmannia clavigera kw1407]EFX01821.1 glutamine amidotransferase subunit pdxt [Grosmannia clavigera kw1407]